MINKQLASVNKESEIADMTLILDVCDRESLEFDLKTSKCKTVNELLIYMITKRLTEHDIEDISYINEYNELEINI